MRKSKQNRKKKQSGTNLKVNPLKRYKKQVKRMKNRLKGVPFEEFGSPAALEMTRTDKIKWQTRLDGAETVLRNWDKLQEQKKADAMKAAALLKK